MRKKNLKILVNHNINRQKVNARKDKIKNKESNNKSKQLEINRIILIHNLKIITWLVKIFK